MPATVGMNSRGGTENHLGGEAGGISGQAGWGLQAKAHKMNPSFLQGWWSLGCPPSFPTLFMLLTVRCGCKTLISVQLNSGGFSCLFLLLRSLLDPAMAI